MFKSIILSLVLLPFAASAQTIAGSNSESSSSSASQSGSQSNNANNVNIISSAPETQRISGEYFSREAIEVTGQQHIKTNTAIGLAAAVSMSSDYCGGTTGVGASAAGITIGGNKPVFDEVCQKARIGEKFGMAAATAYNAGLKHRSFDLQAMSWWEFCTAGNNPQRLAACRRRGLIDDADMPQVGNPQPTNPR